MTDEHRRDGYLISTDPALLDAEAIHHFLSRAYWSEGIPLNTVQRALEGSLCFALYEVESQAEAMDAGRVQQIGLARVITDFATFAYLCDVYVLEEHRGRGLGKWLIECVLESPRLQGLRRWVLVTRDAHGLYREAGFTDLAAPERYMEIARPGIYRVLGLDHDQ
jgi:GNAT superfamily N-acetyltransferase